MRVRIAYHGAGAPVIESEEEIFALPEPGAPYWHEWEAARVLGIRGDAVPVVELVPDPQRTRILCRGLPEGHLVGARQRSDEGVWHAEVVSPGRRVVAWAHATDCDLAVEEAVAHVALQERAAAGYHPERELPR